LNSQRDYGEQLLRTDDVPQSLAVLADARGRAPYYKHPDNQRHHVTLLQIALNEGEAFEAVRDRRKSLEAFRRAAVTAEALRTAQPDDLSSQLAAIHAHHLA
jgi:hypothetical protein